jgi:hypothetical protein
MRLSSLMAAIAALLLPGIAEPSRAQRDTRATRYARDDQLHPREEAARRKTSPPPHGKNRACPPSRTCPYRRQTHRTAAEARSPG